jgi:hypothetical protein
MSSAILLAVDISYSMSNAFGGLERLTKLEAVTKAITTFFDWASKRQKAYGAARRGKLGLLFYRTVWSPERPDFNIVCPLRFFPPIPHKGRLSGIKPGGNSPLLEAILEGSSLLSEAQVDRKLISVITGDSMSNFGLKIGDVETKVITRLKEQCVCVSILQAGHAKESGFKPLVTALQSVTSKHPAESKIALTVRQMSEWLQAPFEAI